MTNKYVLSHILHYFSGIVIIYLWSSPNVCYQTGKKWTLIEGSLNSFNAMVKLKNKDIESWVLEVSFKAMVDEEFINDVPVVYLEITELCGS